MRTTILIGAGAPLDLKFSNGVVCPSTRNITAKVCEDYFDYTIREKSGKVGKTNIVSKIYDRLSDCYPNPNLHDYLSPNPEKGSWINFEQLFHVLEMLDAYQWTWSGGCRNSVMYPVFAPFTKMNFEEFNFDILYGVMKEFIQRIMDIVGDYDNDFKRNNIAENQWYRDFFNLISQKSDIFNLNYDTTIESCLNDYEDGFEEIDSKTSFLQFNPKRLFKNPKSLSTINHLHGCISYFYQRFDNINKDVYTNEAHDMYKYQCYDEVKRHMSGFSRGNPSTQSGERYFPSPILTGLRKTDKLNFSPFDFYHTNLTHSLINNSKLVIIGYGFGDIYINNLINRIYALHGEATRVVCIGYWPIVNDLDMDRVGGCQLNQAEGTFICKVSHLGDFDSVMKMLSKNEKTKGLKYSNNGNLLLFSNGFKDAAQHIDEIQDFLNH